MRKLHFSDHLETHIAKAFDEVGIEYVHESESREQGLDFYLPFFDVYIEVKRISRRPYSKTDVVQR